MCVWQGRDLQWDRGRTLCNLCLHLLYPEPIPWTKLNAGWCNDLQKKRELIFGTRITGTNYFPSPSPGWSFSSRLVLQSDSPAIQHVLSHWPWYWRKIPRSTWNKKKKKEEEHALEWVTGEWWGTVYVEPTTGLYVEAGENCWASQLASQLGLLRGWHTHTAFRGHTQALKVDTLLWKCQESLHPSPPLWLLVRLGVAA